jgi:hypothetical protein
MSVPMNYVENIMFILAVTNMDPERSFILEVCTSLHERIHIVMKGYEFINFVMISPRLHHRADGCFGKKVS